MRGIGAALAMAIAGAAAAETLVVRETQYNTIYIERTGTYVSMLFGRNQNLYTESVANTADPLELPAEYTRYMSLSLAYVPEPRTLLEIGLGGATTSSYLQNTFPDLDITIVELDPVVVELAQEYFFLRPDDGLRVVVRDGRIFLVRSPDTYDVILIDAFRAPFVPFHLQTQEFFQLVEDHLAEGGVMAENVETTTTLFEPVLATIQSVFDHVDLYHSDRSNVVVVAYNGPERAPADLAAAAASIDARFAPRYPLTGLLAARDTIGPVDAQVMTDDFAPVELFTAVERNNADPAVRPLAP
ncbi:MAG: spermidine synthase [Bauldia sp.]